MATLPPPDHPDLPPRQRAVLARVAAQGFATIEALAQQFGVSTQTVRRDIAALCERRLLQRFHGGANLPGAPSAGAGTVRLGHDEKAHLRAEGKARIARALAGEVADGTSVFLDVGTTTEAVARALAARARLQVVTCGLEAARAFAGHDSTETFVTGGILRGADGSLVGDAAIRAVEGFKVDVAVIGLSGFDEDGTLMDFDIQKVALKQAIIRNARRVFAVADASKFARAAVVRVAPPRAIAALFTDAPPPPRLDAIFRQEGVRIVVG